MIWFKQCPRCMGDLFNSHDSYSEYVSCVQCGHELTDEELLDLHASGRVMRRDLRRHSRTRASAV